MTEKENIVMQMIDGEDRADFRHVMILAILILVGHFAPQTSCFVHIFPPVM